MVWKGGRLYLRRRFDTGAVKRRLLLASGALALAAGGTAVALRSGADAE